MTVYEFIQDFLICILSEALKDDLQLHLNLYAICQV